MAVEIIFDHSDEARRAIGTGLGKAIVAIAQSIEGQAKMRAPVDTGFAKNSIHTATRTTSTAEQARAAAEGAFRTKHPTQETPAFAGESATGEKWNAAVAVGAEYGAALEYGTKNQAAQPYLTPAVEVVRGEVEDITGSAINRELARITGGGA